jgi:hypothetical protein
VFKEHLRIQNRLLEISKEILAMPEMPKSQDWMNSIPDIDGNKKTMSLPQLAKRNKLRREFQKLKEEETENMRLIKILQIEELIERINDTDSVETSDKVENV